MINDNLKLAKYRFTLEAIDKINLPTYKGSTFHGGVGHALMQISPIWYRYFFESGVDNKKDWPKPFVILPPLDELEIYPKGHLFYCELTLIGEATQHYAIAQAAIEYLGLQIGLGRHQAKFKIRAIDKAVAGTENNHNNHFVYGKDIINARVPTLSPEQQTLFFPSRLRLKKSNRLYRETPTFQLIFERLLGRLKTLEKAYGKYQPDKDREHLQLIAKAATITTKKQDIHWDEWDRYSGRQKNWMKFGGHVGTISYSGNLVPFLPYLAIGEWVHIGGKTSFGLGKYVMENIK